ncbi:hypothetical protein [Erwinia piriflorinigrans]|uniref:hypothetical protein n=1 Tax=Erwinia piriflorinigrans TaxID=665097 RepID=UPI000AD71B08|nr:hypothetical protein [Erwinia piriflorinigrans]
MKASSPYFLHGAKNLISSLEEAPQKWRRQRFVQLKGATLLFWIDGVGAIRDDG